MKLRVYDQTFDHNAVIGDSLIGDLRDLKRETGIGMQTVAGSLIRLGGFTSFEDVYDDAELLDSLIALSWLCLRRDDPALVFADHVAKVKLRDLEFVPDATDAAEAVEADPTQALEAETPQGSNNESSAPAGKPHAGKPKKSTSAGTSKTSKPQSSATS
jgi:hypothetical protein